ncbi:hypothetical protein, partial [Akkermansia muciniphila]|uniref:hypothetical protein n=1 Tax=Akkermansia muciniphila TaxID=239935 RepID=UPI002553B871
RFYVFSEWPVKAPGPVPRGVSVSSASTGRRHAESIRKGRSCPRQGDAPARREQRTGEKPAHAGTGTPLFHPPRCLFHPCSGKVEHATC